MSGEPDFAIDPGDLQPAVEPSAESFTAPPEGPDADADVDASPAPAPASTSVPPPLVVIQYRNRGLHMAILPPLLILITALVITSYQRQARLRPLAPTFTAATKEAAPATPAGRGRVIMVAESVTGAAVEPIQVRAATPPPLPPPLAPAPALEAEPIAKEALARAGDPLQPDPFSLLDLEGEPAGPGGEAKVEPPLEPPVPPRTIVVGSLSPDSPERAFGIVGGGLPGSLSPNPSPSPG